MRKTRCPQCGVINLEGFITFPHCAGCGMLLPALPPVEKKSWRRPLRTALWTSVAGALVTFAAMVAIRALGPDVQDQKRVVLSASPTRTATVSRRAPLVLVVDALDGQATSDAVPVKVRVPRDFFRNFQLISLEPRPDSVETRGGGLYFSYRELPSGTHLRFLLMPLRAGRFHLAARLFCDNQFQNECRILLDVAPPPRRTPQR